MKKKLLTVLLVSTMVFGLVACGDNAEVEDVEAVSGVETVEETEAAEVIEGGRIEFTPPEGFTVEDPNTENMFYTENYPTDTANYNVQYTENDPVTFTYTKESYCDVLKQVFKSQYDVDVDVDCTEFTTTELDGHQVRIIRTSYTIQDTGIDQIQCAVQLGDGCETVTYTQPIGGDWTDEFEASMNTIHVVAE